MRAELVRLVGSRVIKVAIDGPSACGKGTYSIGVANMLGLKSVDTGSLYRRISERAMRLGFSVAEPELIVSLAQSLKIELVGHEIWVDGERPSTLLNTPEVTAFTKEVAKILGVRAVVKRFQDSLIDVPPGTVTNGRDACYAIDTPHRYYIDADPKVRARWRHKDYVAQATEKGETPPSFEQVLADLNSRDYEDRNRKESPLRQHPDALPVNVTYKTIEQAVRIIATTVIEHERALSKKAAR